MRLLRLATSLTAVALAASLSSASVSGQSQTPDQNRLGALASGETASAITLDASRESGSAQFATLRGIKAAPMASDELKAVKGLHVHFIVAPSQNDQYGLTGLHLAGDVKTENNWQNLGGTDPAPVAPSYHGLCVAVGVSSVISIPFNPAQGTQCP